MTLWIGVLAAAAGCYLLKLLGLSIPHGVLERPTVRRIAALLPVALLAALVGVQTFGEGQSVVIDARLAGLAAAIAALLLRAPFLVVVFAAAGTTALLRLAF
jgi:branched-subunit amino acid transport protein